MKIEKNRVATIEYELKAVDGEILDSSDENGALSYIQGSGFLFPGLEKALEGLKKGDKLERVFLPADAYGEYDDSLVFKVTRSDFEDGIELYEGLEFQAEVADESRVCTIIGIEGDQFTVDANHPLCDEKLEVKVSILDVREATAVELDHGHVHDGSEEH